MGKDTAEIYKMKDIKVLGSWIIGREIKGEFRNRKHVGVGQLKERSHEGREARDKYDQNLSIMDMGIFYDPE
jgi:hypothetical protein